jgi:hypothetical protein
MTDHPGFDLPPKASPEIIEERQALAGGPHYHRPGVDVHVTPFVDGGVFANWRTDAELRDPALDLFAQGIDYNNPPPVLRHYHTVLNQMQTALMEILASAGFDVEEPDGHSYGSMVLVTGG